MQGRRRNVQIHPTQSEHKSTAAKLSAIAATLKEIVALFTTRYGRSHPVTKDVVRIEGDTHSLRVTLDNKARSEFPDSLLSYIKDAATKGMTVSSEMLKQALATEGDGVGQTD